MAQRHRASRTVIDIKCIPGPTLGKGGFGEVSELLGTEGMLVAKIEKRTESSRILHEYNIYSCLSGASVVPEVKGLLQLRDRSVLIMEHAGIPLKDYVREHDLVPTVAERQILVAYCASKMIMALHTIHAKGVIHGDIHPGNFVVKKTPSGEVFRLIDFGAAIAVGSPKSTFEAGWEINYTFASLERTMSPQDGPSIADDLVALGYTLIYLVNGQLPWQDLVDSPSSPTHINLIVDAKRLYGADALCKGLPVVFCNFLTFVLQLINLAVPNDAEYETHSRAFCDFAQQKTASMGKTPFSN